MKKRTSPKIKKNSSISILSNIKKQQLNETKLLFYNVLLMLVVIILVSYITVFAVGKNNIFTNIPENLTHEETLNLITKPLFLTKKAILKDSKGLLTKPFTFEVVNKKKTTTSYRLVLLEDASSIKKDHCTDKQVSIDTLKYSLDGKTILALKDTYKNNEYILLEETIPPLSTKKYSLNLWINNMLLKDKNKKHFHGRLVLEEY